MFSYLKAMYHQSKIQAELKVQIHEQTTVNAICHHPESIEIIAVCSTDAYYRKRKDAAFLTTCSVLMRTLKDESVPMVLRKTAWRLLNERYQRIKLNQAYRIENFLLVADFEYALEEHDELGKVRISRSFLPKLTR
ncbi:MAG: hypothetical protein E6326_24645 [Enterobacter roggenkampii]|nr:hypothetical protein [Enterobacter roggenkampii]MDU7047098.1 hypothetical protein [Enterobacter roggenkampii]QLW20003.1 hypothetical protein HV184_04020 [Enterobacter cloacae]TYF62735.1 hypothetical protein DJ544_25345 [Enterobacter roggenkampii]